MSMKVVPKGAVVFPHLVTILQKGGVIAMPTETSYGLVADSTNKTAIARVYAIKGRDYSNPLPVVVASVEEARDFFVFNDDSEKVAKKYWPGPVSIRVNVLSDRLKEGDRATVNTRDATVVVRATSYPMLQQLVDALGVPLVATSANISGQETPYSAMQVMDQFADHEEQPDIVVDGGTLAKVAPSTIVEITDGQMHVLREGPIEVAL